MGDRERARKEREKHHQLVTQQRAASEQLRRSMPRLSYEMPRR
jgi:hypothetical protein